MSTVHSLVSRPFPAKQNVKKHGTAEAPSHLGFVICPGDPRKRRKFNSSTMALLNGVFTPFLPRPSWTGPKKCQDFYAAPMV